MDVQAIQEMLRTVLAPEDFRRVEIPSAPARLWMHQAQRMTLEQALRRLLALLPNEPPVESMELVDVARAHAIRQNLAARAVVSALLHAASVQDAGAVARGKTVT